MLDPPIKILRFLLLLGILFTAASTSKLSSIEEFSFDDYNADFLNEIASEKFSCEGRPYGYYADQAQDCKVFHICSPIESSSGRHVKSFMYSFNCPETTIFSQDSRTCITEKYALPCRRAHTLYSLNKSIGQITPKGARKHVPGVTFNTNLHTSNVISGNSVVTPKTTLQSVPRQRFPSGNSNYKPAVRGVSQTAINFVNTDKKLNSAQIEASVNNSFDLKFIVDSTAAEKSEAKAIDSFKNKNFDETLRTDGKKTENIDKEQSFSTSIDKTLTPNTIPLRIKDVHQSLLSSQKSPKDGHHVNKLPIHHPAVEKSIPSFNFRASLGNDHKEEENHTISREGTIASDNHLVHDKDSPSKESLVSNDHQSLVQNVRSTQDRKPLVNNSSSNPILSSKSNETTTSSNTESTLINKFNKIQSLDVNKFTDFSDYEINDPELEEIYEEIYEFKPKSSDLDHDSAGYVGSKELDSENDFTYQKQNKNANNQKSSILRGALSEKILPPPPISNSLLNHNVILTNIRARHNETTKSINLDNILAVTTQIENKFEENDRNTINVQTTTKATKRVVNNVQRGRGRSQSSSGRTMEEGKINNIGRVEQKPSPPSTVTGSPLLVRTTAAFPKITTTTRSPVPRNLATTTLRAIPSERGAKRFVPSSLLRQNNKLKESQLNKIEEHMKIKPKKQSINILNAIPIIQTINAIQDLHLAPITDITKTSVTTSRPLEVTSTSRSINSFHNNVNLVTVTEKETSVTTPHEDIQTTTETNDFDKKRIINARHKNIELVDSSQLDKPPIAEINKKESILPKEQNGKVRKITRTRISPNSEISNLGKAPAARNPSNRASTDPQSVNNFEQKENKVSVNSNTFIKKIEYLQSELETTVGPLDEQFFDNLNLKKKIAVETDSFRQINSSINNKEAIVNSQKDAFHQENLKSNRGGPSHGELNRNNERQIVSQATDSTRQFEGIEKATVSSSGSKVMNEVVSSQVSSRRTTKSRNRGSATFNPDQKDNAGLDGIRQSKSIDANVPVEQPKLTDVAGNSVRQIPSKTRIFPSSRTVIISNINQINSSTPEIDKIKTGMEAPIRKRVVASPQPSNNHRRENNDSKDTGLKTGAIPQVSLTKNVGENNLAGRTNLLPKISGKLNLDQLSKIEEQIQRFASVNGAQLISYTVKKNDKHPKNKNKIGTTQRTKNITEVKLNALTNSIKEEPKMISSKPSVPGVPSVVASVGKSNNIISPSKVQVADITSVKKSSITINFDDKLIETVPTTAGPLISPISHTIEENEKEYLTQNTQTNFQNEEPQSRSLKKNIEVNSVKLFSTGTTDNMPKIIGSSISATLDADIGRIRPAVNSIKKAGSSLDVNVQPIVITRLRSAPQQSRSSIAIVEIPTNTTITDEFIQELTTAVPRVVPRSRGRSQSVRKLAETISTMKSLIDLNNNATEVNDELENENNFKDSPVLPEKTPVEEKNNAAKNLRGSNLEKIRNRVSAIQRKKEILPENVDDKNSVKSTENPTTGVRSPVNLLNSLKNIKSQRKRFKGASSPVTSFISLNGEPEIEVTTEVVDDFQTTTSPSVLKPSLNSRRSQERQPGRSRNLSAQESLKGNIEKSDELEPTKLIKSNEEREIPVGTTIWPVNSQNSRSGRSRDRSSNTQKIAVSITETNTLAISEQEVPNEQFVNDNKNHNVANSLRSRPKRITRTKKPLLSPSLPEPQEITSKDNENLVITLNLESTTANSARRESKKRISSHKIESTFAPKIQRSQQDTKSDPNKIEENSGLGINSVPAEKTPINSILRVSRKRVTTQTKPNVFEPTNKNNVTGVDSNKIDVVIPLVKKVSPNMLNSFTTTTEKPSSISRRKNHSSRGGDKEALANDGSQFAHELLTDVNESPKISTSAKQYSIAVSGSEANTKKKVLKKVSPARQFQQKLSEGAVENAEVFSGLKLRVVGTSVKSSTSSTSKSNDKKSSLDLIALASATNTRTLTDLELDALRSLTQVNEPLRQPGRSRNVNRRLISKRKV